MGRRFMLAGPAAMGALKKAKLDPITFQLDRPGADAVTRSNRWKAKWNAKRAIDIMAARARRDPERRDGWTDDEDALVRQWQAGALSMPELTARLPHRTPPAIHKRRSRLGLSTIQQGPREARAWTDAEIELLRSGMQIAEIAAKLDRTPQSVKDKRKRLGLTDAPSTFWTEQELRALTSADGRARLVQSRGKKAVERAIWRQTRREAKTAALLVSIRAELGFIRAAHLKAELEAAAYVLLKDKLATNPKAAVRAAYTAHFGDRFVSLDDTGPGGDGRALIDRIDAETFHL